MVGSRAVFSFTKPLLTVSNWICIGSEIFFCMDSTVLPGVNVSISGPFGTFEAPRSILPGPHDLVIFLVLYFPTCPPCWCSCSNIWRTWCVRYYLIIFIGKDRCWGFGEFLSCDLLILGYPFRTSVGEWSCQPASCVSSFKVLWTFSFQHEHLLQGYLKILLHTPNFLFASDCPVLWPFIFSFSSFSLSEISSCSLIHSPDTFWAACPLIYLKRSRG